MKIETKVALLIGCLFMLAASMSAADNTGGKSDLSATETESYQIRNKKFGDLLRPGKRQQHRGHAHCAVSRRTVEMHDLETTPGR